MSQGFDMRVLAVALTLATCVIPYASAGGQYVLSDPEQATTEIFWNGVYPSGGTTLYCGKPFKDDQNGALTASRIYNIKQIKSALRCMTETQCTVKTPKYLFMISDLHNLYPATTSIEEERRNAVFGELGEDSRKPNDLGCDTHATYHLIEPRDAVKGDIARAFFYMHAEYMLPISQELATLKKWSAMDPPDAEEKARNDRIEAIQGTRNRFIDNPGLIDTLTDD